MAMKQICYAGNTWEPVDSGIGDVGVIFGVTESGDLILYQFKGTGAHGDWVSHTGEVIGNGGWRRFRQILGCGNRVILAIEQNGDLRWYQHTGGGWHPHSGHIIGNGWQNFRHVFVNPRQGRGDSRLRIYGVKDNGNLFYYQYDGNGKNDPSGTVDWHPHSGHIIGNGWQNFRHIWGGYAIFAIKHNGDLLWYTYSGDGTQDPSGNLGWAPNSGHIIGNGWQDFHAITGGFDFNNHDVGEAIYAVQQNGDMRWYGYSGDGTQDPSGNLGWHPNSSKVIGRGW